MRALPFGGYQLSSMITFMFVFVEPANFRCFVLGFVITVWSVGTFGCRQLHVSPHQAGYRQSQNDKRLNLFSSLENHLNP